MKTMIKQVWQSLQFALNGIKLTYQNEHMFPFYLTIIVLVIVLEVFLQFPLLKIEITIFCGGGILAFELINTGVEKAIDATNIYNEETKFAKDAAAGSVTVFAVCAAVTVILFFIDHFTG